MDRKLYFARRKFLRVHLLSGITMVVAPSREDGVTRLALLESSHSPPLSEPSPLSEPFQLLL
jgi:hypothetical protein